MNKNLIVCRTPFQVITALVLVHSRLRNDENDIIITSDFRQSREVSQLCAKLGCFRNSYFFDYSKFNYVVGVVNPNVFLGQLAKSSINNYTYIYTNSTYGDLENALLYYNQNAEIVLYDEGYSSYLDLALKKSLSVKHKICVAISKILYPRKLSHQCISKQLLYDPDLIVYDMPFKIERLWQQEQNVMKKVMADVSEIFDVKKAIGEYSTKYIYFEECFANDFNNNGDLEIIDMIASIVGRDSLMVKLHPRDKTNRFNDKGIKTNRILSIPTEALLSEMEKKDKVFISFSSGSAINYKFICDYNIKTILLYKLLPDSFVKMSPLQTIWFDRFIAKYKGNIFAPRTKEELNSIIKML